MFEKKEIDIYYLAAWFQNLIMLFVFCFILYITVRHKLKGSLWLIFAYSFCSIFISITSITNILFNWPLHKIWIQLNYASFIPHYIFLSLFIFLVEYPLMLTKNTALLYWLCLIIFSILFYLGLSDDKFFIIYLCNIILVSFCIIYFVRLFSSAKPIIVVKNYSFWIVTGIFCCLLFTIPMIFIYYLLYKQNVLDVSAYKSISAIASLAYGGMHLFFLKGFLCYKIENSNPV